MERHQVRTDHAPAPGGAYSQAIVAGQLVFVAGQVGRNPESGQLPASLEDQVRQAISNLDAVLVAAGATSGSVVKTTCFLADIGSFAAFDRVYAAAFPEPRPARSTVGVTLAGELLFEIEAVAVLPSESDNR